MAIARSISCNCTRASTTNSCACLANGLRCTDMCRLKECENKATDEDDNEYKSDKKDENDQNEESSDESDED